MSLLSAPASILVDPTAIRWTAANTQEALKDPVTPLTWSLFSPLIDSGRRRLFRAAGFNEIPGPGPLRLIHGRPYFNPRYFRSFLSQIPGAPQNIFDALIFGEGIAQIRFEPRLFNAQSARMAWLLLRLRIGAKRRFRRFERRFRAELAPHLELDLTSLGAGALIEERQSLSTLAEEALHRHVEGTALAGASYLLFDLLLRSQGLERELGPNLAGRLTAGVPGNVLAEMARALKELARLRQEQPSSFADALSSFLLRFGQRSEDEAELASPRWSEDPSPVLRILESYETTTLQAEPDGRERRHATEARSLAREARAALRRRGLCLAPPRLLLFEVMLQQARAFAPDRENLKSLALEALARLRAVLLEQGRRLCGPDRPLESVGSAFLLELDELDALSRGQSLEGSPPPRALVEAARDGA